ncbi:MAG: gamma-glutamyltransferase [Candidatus Schekmanbacteria bacterium]|nr:gamma-glutamyltransferase [Candidatus Schekmanbacteria bacterium]
MSSGARSFRRRGSISAVLACLLLGACRGLPPAGERPAAPAGAAIQAHPAAKEDIAPEASSGLRHLESVRARHFMVAAANPYAAAAGYEILLAGGSATDAAIAMSLTLALVEPQSSGIGGGAFLLCFDAGANAVIAYDGRETAPSAATPDMFLGPDGGAMEFLDAVIGGLSVGVPGLLRMLELAHREHGKLPWDRLFAPAIQLAERGFVVSPRLHALLAMDPFLRQSAAPRQQYYLTTGEPLPVGTILTNRPLAEVLRAVASGGADAFYTGAIARDIAAAVQSAAPRPGRLALADLQGYQARKRSPVCSTYRRYRVCGMPPPTSGGITTLQILGMLDTFDLPALPAEGPEATHLYLEASRLAFADRDSYLADPDFVTVPTAALLDPAYLKQRARLILPDHPPGTALPGRPAGAEHRGTDRSPELPSTTHLAAVDADGNAVTMTASIENLFGSRIMVHGFLLNNELTDFSFVPEEDGHSIANRVEPGKRPRSSMNPVLVFAQDTGELKLAIGSAGGSRIIGFVTRVLLLVLDGEMDIQQAIDRPHVLNRNGPTEVENVAGAQAIAESLRARGHEVILGELNSGTQAIVVQRDDRGRHYVGGADPRREGRILGE